MPNPKARQVEENVLAVYQKENPSTYRIEKNADLLNKIEQSSYQLYTKSLKLLPKIFEGADLLEFGVGTGENSLCFLKWNANCTFVDINYKAINRAEFLFNKYYPNSDYDIVKSSISDFETEKKFDITISKGVIHHTPDKEKTFAKQVSYLKPGGVNILGIGNSAGGLQRNLQRHIIYTFAGRDEKKIETIANDLFKEHLDRAVKFGGRTRKAIIYDTYVNPQMDSISISELLQWYKKYNLNLFSNWPPIVPSILANSLAGKTDWRNFPELLSFSEWIWATQRDDDKHFAKELEQGVKQRTSSFRELSKTLNNVQAENLNPKEIVQHIEHVYQQYTTTRLKSLQNTRKFKAWLVEMKNVMEAVSSKDYTRLSLLIKQAKHLFRGRGGLGMNYFVAIKQKDE